MEEEEVKVVSEFGKLDIARAKAARERKELKRKKKLIRASQAYGFDFGASYPRFRITESPMPFDYHIILYASLGLHCYNFHKGTNLKFVHWVKFTTMCTSYCDFYITLEAMDPACNSVISFQTLYSRIGRSVEGVCIWQILACRPTCNKAVNDNRDETMDQYYPAEMPQWLSDEALTSDNKKYYVVKESELHENDWLHLFMEIAFFEASPVTQLVAYPTLEIDKVVVETKEDYTTEAREKLHAENAIFYISYKYKGDSSTGFSADKRAIIRKTMDGVPEHMTLEFTSRCG
ncbi:hypothetical protein CARUB_v10026900mg [Capsella rubella]|uniref:Uncharacterized protein n=1 Tax=Capsella rubella TaxID=81985 RepID=R0GN78_9BRAS|nr:UPF0725 protein At5g63820 isoform X2 [Capsella rubella]EOA13805.1 hypothetical protein CARUB_v10026900mg [Capsella rubella]